MKRLQVASLVLVGVAGLALSSCSGKLRPITKDQVRVQPDPLTLVGGQVPAKISVSIPAKAFPKKATLRITPVLRYSGGEKWGQSYGYQGENVYGNDIVVNYKNGGNLQLNFSVPYASAMSASELYLVFQGKKGSRSVKLSDLKIADGVISTEALASVEGILPAIAPDGFQRIITEEYDADIMFQIQQSNVRSSELKKDDVEEWKYIVQNAKETPNQRVSVEVQSYASPEGGRALNERLSQSREQNTTSALKREFKAQDMAGVAIDAHYTAQDWEGFRRLVEASDLQDKELVLRVLSMYPDTESREREIRNISAIFSKLTEEILPRLRRSRLVANVEIIGKSDDEIQEFVEKAPGHLTIEELLYAATLAKTDDAKVRIYQMVNKIFPKDYRAYNNIGAILYSQGQLDQAETWFKAAAERGSSSAIDMNLGLLELAKGNLSEATAKITSATDVPELGQALGFLYLQQGEYAKAATAFGSTVSDNAAVAQILNQDYSSALKTIAAIAKPTAKTYLIKAIAAARTQDANLALESLRQVAQLDPSLLLGLERNLEFSTLLSNPSFRQLLSTVTSLGR